MARLVGQRLHWKVYDEELIQAIAHRMVLPLDDVRALDEQAPSMVQDWLLPLRELMSVAVMAASYAGRRVDWRGYTLEAEGFNPR